MSNRKSKFGEKGHAPNMEKTNFQSLSKSGSLSISLEFGDRELRVEASVMLRLSKSE